MSHERLQDLSRRVDKCCQRSGRQRDDIMLIGVCKRQNFEAIYSHFQAGVIELGENTLQGLEATDQSFKGMGVEPRWHFVGHLQRRKVKKLLTYRPTIHSVDRLALAQEISFRNQNEAEVDILLQVNTGREAQKGGVVPEKTIEFAQEVAALKGLRLRGLMALPPRDESSRRHFECLRELSQKLQQTSFGRHATHLSMGMSNDFEEAIECGATMIRIGTTLYGDRTNHSITHKE
jgi:PLP dependent protein